MAKLVESIAFVGGGNMGQAILRGILRAGLVAPDQVMVGDRRKEARERCEEEYGVEVTADNREAVSNADVVILAVKPQIANDVLDEISSAMRPGSLVISIAAGISIAALEARLGAEIRVVRTMPNVCCIVGQGATGVAGGSRATDADLALARAIFEAVGLVVVLEEYLLNSVTGLSGSGPAYIFMVIEALADAGVKTGLSRWDAHALACQTVLGAAKLTIETQDHPGRLKDMVCSPGGTAIAAVHRLEAGGLRTTLINAVEVAAERAKQLGRDLE